VFDKPLDGLGIVPGSWYGLIGVLTAPLVHGSMLSLDLLAATGGILGFLAWRWAHYLRLRAGAYYEPARTAESESRLHGTGGLDVKLFRFGLFGLLEPFDYWQLSLAADVARSYLSTSFSLGFWY
jgi:hypothetical protein